MVGDDVDGPQQGHCEGREPEPEQARPGAVGLRGPAPVIDEARRSGEEAEDDGGIEAFEKAQCSSRYSVRASLIQPPMPPRRMMPPTMMIAGMLSM